MHTVAAPYDGGACGNDDKRSGGSKRAAGSVLLFVYLDSLLLLGLRTGTAIGTAASMLRFLIRLFLFQRHGGRGGSSGSKRQRGVAWRGVVWWRPIDGGIDAESFS